MSDLQHRAAAIDRLPADCTAGDVVSALDRVGGVIIERYIGSEAVQAIREELAPHVDRCPTGRDGFTGRRTTRVGAIMARSATSHRLVLDPMLNAAATAFLGRNADLHQLHLTQLAVIGPGEGHQPLHRDRAVWGGHVPRSIETQFSMVWALTDFSADNGATRFVPGSQHWDDDRRAEPDEITHAEMPAGSVLVYTGSVLHGGGENRTAVPREGLLLHFAPAWLRQEENQYLSCPPHIAQHFSPELRGLLGYRATFAMGFCSPPVPPGVDAELVSPEHIFREPTDWPGLA